MRILLIEDDKYVSSALKRGLRNSYIIDAAATAEEGYSYLDTSEYDVILLDLDLPDKPGKSVCKDLRSNGNSTPILILTGMVEIDEKVSLLDLGADDYLTKPFSLEELKARIRALLRRESANITSSEISVGGLILDSANRTCSRDGIELSLRRKEFDLLEYLMLNNGKSLTRQMILDHVWDMNDNLWTNAIDVHIKYLRDKVDRPFEIKLIQTIHGIGYKLDPNVRANNTKQLVA